MSLRGNIENGAAPAWPEGGAGRSLADRERWQAVRRRDRAADGSFVYSVRTTGVYCRPSCAARLPRRENVRFHATCEEAERAGFRPCKRCRPNGSSLAERRAAAIAKACRTIERAEELPSLAALAHAAGLSRFHFHRVFKAVTGVTPKAYGEAHRARRLREELSRGASVTEAIYGAGFNSSGRFYATSSELLGMTPSAFRAGGSGAVIRFAIGQCAVSFPAHLSGAFALPLAKAAPLIALAAPWYSLRAREAPFQMSSSIGAPVALVRHVDSRPRQSHAGPNTTHVLYIYSAPATQRTVRGRRASPSAGALIARAGSHGRIAVRARAGS
jgi:methylphosphotriester-DNA--protein-cysteine methyltransferase